MKSMKRLGVILATTSLFLAAGCGSSDTKATTANPQAEATESCCGSGAADEACAAEAGGCCAGEEKAKP